MKGHENQKTEERHAVPAFMFHLQKPTSYFRNQLASPV